MTIDIAKIRAVAEAATQGRFHIGFDNLITDGINGNKVPVTHICSSVNGAVLTYVRSSSDAAFIATANTATVIAMCDEIERLRREVNALNAARFAYASEFPLNADGEPDVGSIHQNIRAMRKDAARYRWLKANNRIWSWTPSQYNKEIVSGFAYKQTGYSGFDFETAIDKAMEAKT